MTKIVKQSVESELVKILNMISDAAHGLWDPIVGNNLKKLEYLYETTSDIARKLGIIVTDARDIYDDEVYPAQQMQSANEDQEQPGFEQLNLFEHGRGNVRLGKNDKKKTHRPAKQVRERRKAIKNNRGVKTNGNKAKKKNGHPGADKNSRRKR